MDDEQALYFAEPDVFDEDDLDPQSDECEASEYVAYSGDR